MQALRTSSQRQITVNADAIRFGALIPMSEAAGHAGVRQAAPVIAESLQLAASGQYGEPWREPVAADPLRVFSRTTWPCNKREPGLGCSALHGFNRQHAVLGTSDARISTYHGDFAQALIALDAALEVRGPVGTRRLPFAKLHRLPPNVKTDLDADDIIMAIKVPMGA